MTRLCYPLDAPLGARIVREGIVIVEKALWNDGQVVAILGDDEMTRLYDRAERIEIDEDTPQRAARLHRASRLLSGDLS